LFIFASWRVAAQDNSSTNQMPSIGQQRFKALVYTTPAYRKEALRLVIAEANRVAQELNLPEKLPIEETNLVAAYIPPPKMAQRLGGVGNVTTSNYVYYVSVAGKFSFLDHTHMEQERLKMRHQSLLPISRMDTNSAYQMATQWLNAVEMNVPALVSNCDVHVEVVLPEGENSNHFVPLYTIYWTSRQPAAHGAVATVEYYQPTKTLLKLRVSKPEYILRPPLQITNLDFLLSQTNSP
jgi:hypothetical protein